MENSVTNNHLRISQRVNEGIVYHHPTAILPNEFKKKVQKGAEVIAKLEKRGYSVDDIENVFMWALGDDFWKNVFLSIPAVLVIKKNGEIKFQNMLNQYKNLFSQTPHEKRISTIKFYAKETYKYTESNLVDLEEDLHWFHLKVDQINDSLSKENRMEWINSIRFVEVGKWLVDIEMRVCDNDHIGNFKDLMSYYFGYLKKGLQRNRPKQIYPALFSDKSGHFAHFLSNLEDQWEIELLREE